MRKKTELTEQQAVIEWCEWMSAQYPELKTIYHITNEGKRSKSQGAALVAAGLKKGVPDLCLPVSRGGYNALYIEMKKSWKEHCTKEQQEFQILLAEQGNFCCVAHGFDEVKEYIERYIKMPKGRVVYD